MGKKPAKADHAKPRRKRRRLLIAVPGVLGVAVVGFMVLRSPVMKAVVIPRIERLAGVELDADVIYIATDLRVIVTDAVVRTPAVAGPAGELLSFDRLEARLNWSKLFSGASDGVVKTLELDDPVLRLSQDVDTGVLNAATLSISGRGGPPTIPENLPRVQIREGRLEMGEHQGGTFTELHVVPFEGALTPLARSDAGPNVFVVRAESKNPVGVLGTAPELEGEIEPDGVTIAIKGVTIEDWPADRVPTRFRETFNRLSLEGRVEPREIRVDAAGGVEFDVAFRDVALDLPFNAVRPGADPSVALDEQLLRMSGVRGSMTVGTTGLRARLVGQVDDLPYDVAFDYWGLGPTSPFLARLQAGPSRVARGTNIFRFTPEVVVEKMDLFVDPEVEMMSTVWLRRGVPPAERVATASLELPDKLAEPTGPADSRVLIAGEIELLDGTTAYKNFPYPFREINGAFAFDQERLEIRNIRAKAGSGAELLVDGWVTPLSDAARVALSIEVEQLPVDRDLFQTLGPERSAVISALFSSVQLERLYEDGLLRRPTGEDDGKLHSAPEFALRGVANIRVDLERLFGDESVWRQRLEIELNKAGLLSEHFPLPLLGDGINVVIEDNVATLESGSYTTLRGGDVTLWARADVSKDSKKPAPTVRITASDVPIDDLLIRAVPGPGALADEAGPADLSTLLERLRLRGTLDCVADIGPHPDYGIGWDIVVNVEDVDASPDPQGDIAQRDDASPGVDEELVLSGVTGVIRAQRERIGLELEATASAEVPGRLGPQTPEPEDPTTVTMYAQIDLPPAPDGGGPPIPPIPPEVITLAAAENLDLELPIERLLSLFAPEFSGRLADLRETYNPAGRLDLAAELTGELGPNIANSARIELTADQIRTVAADTFGGRVSLTDVEGRAVLDTGAAAVITFEGLGADLVFDEDEAGRVRLTGVLPLGTPGPWPILGVPDFPQLRAEITDGRFESELTLAVINERLGDRLSEVYADLDPAGVYDLDLFLTPSGPGESEERAGEDVDRGALLRADINGVLYPSSLSLNSGSGRLEADRIDGRVTFSRTGGTLDALRGVGDGWSFDIDGDWRTPAGGAFRVAADFGSVVEADESGVPQRFIDALPASGVKLVDRIKLTSTGGLAVREGRLIIERPDPIERPGVGTEVVVRGDVSFAGAGFDVGLPISHADGTARVDYWRRSGNDSTEPERGWSIAVATDNLYLSGVELHNTKAKLLGGRSPGEVLIPDITADVHGGRLAAAVRLDPMGDPADEQIRFTTEARIADVRLAPLLADLSLGLRPELSQLATSITQEQTGPQRIDLDESRGVVDGGLTLTGPVGPLEGLRGRARLRASGGPVLALPALTPLIEFSNLQLPVGERLDLAEASVVIRDDRATFESIGVLSESIEIIGFGSMHWPTADLDLRFRSEAVRRIPIISPLVEAVRNELITTRVSGPIGNPVVSADSLVATRRVLSSLLGRPESPEATRLRQIEARAAAERDRSLRALRRTVAIDATEE
ncbi:MAG: hypothetical protein AAGI53_06510 [Planctomycetota bacterium]